MFYDWQQDDFEIGLPQSHGFGRRVKVDKGSGLCYTDVMGTWEKYPNMNLDGLRDAIVKMPGHESVPVRIGTFKNDMKNLRTKPHTNKTHPTRR